jgi:hypothetical protein
MSRRSIVLSALLLPLLAALAARPARAGWEEAKGPFLQAQRSPEWKTRKLAYVAAADHESAATVDGLLAALAKEEHAVVLGAGLDVLSSVRTADARKGLVEAAKSGKGAVRLLAVAALAGHPPSADADAALAAALAAPEAPVAAQAALVLSEGERARPVPALVRLLSHADRRVRGAAARALGAAKDRAALAPLAALLAKESGHARLEVVRALEAIDGTARGYAPATWKAVASGAKDLPKETPRLFPTAFGLPIAGERVVFVLDRSLLMADAHPFDRRRLEELSTPKDGEPIPWFRLKTKLEFAVAQVLHAIAGLESGSKFEVVSFAEDVRGHFELRFASAGAGSRKAIAESLAAIEVDDGMNVWGALDAALAVGGGNDAQAWKSGPEVVVFVTNNLPNKGDVTDGGEIASGIGWRARLRQVPVHAVGIANHPYALAEGLAKRTGGVYLSLLE